MGIESNKEAVAMMKNALGSIENRFREAYNKGYKDGIKEGINQAMQKIADSIFEEVEAEPQTATDLKEVCREEDDEFTDRLIEEQLANKLLTDCAWNHG